jgi:4-hydroxy-tetrahydrodipicolinate reductase
VDDALAASLHGSGAQVLVDFTTPSAGLQNALVAVEAGVAPVVGTTGLGAGVDRIRDSCLRSGTGGCVAANFALGAALLMWIAELCAPHFEHAEIIEAHNPLKADAPSGTALRTAERMLAARRGRGFAQRAPETTPLHGTRGGALGGIGIHSLRLEGVVADQEVVLGAPGQTLTLAHRTTSRAAFAPGVLLAASRVVATRGFYDSLEAVLGLPAAAAVAGMAGGSTS